MRDQGMQSAVWGPAAWFFLHCMAANYPIHPTHERRRAHGHFLQNLGSVLPCRFCRERFKENLKDSLLKTRPKKWGDHIFNAKLVEWPVDQQLWCWPQFKNRRRFSRLVWQLHRSVNECLGKPRGLSLKETREKYEQYRATCKEDNKECVASGGRRRKCVLDVVEG